MLVICPDEDINQPLLDEWFELISINIRNTEEAV